MGMVSPPESASPPSLQGDNTTGRGNPSHGVRWYGLRRSLSAGRVL